jgi:hypothetical protein
MRLSRVGGGGGGVRVHGFRLLFLFCFVYWGKNDGWETAPMQEDGAQRSLLLFFSCLFSLLVDDGAGVQTVYADQTV